MEMMQIGQPVGGVVQMAYVVEDIQRSMLEFSDRLGIGPWFVSGPFVPPEGRYRGEPTDMSLTLAVAFSGHVTVELIQQHDNKPSVYQETVAKSGYGFHHWAITARDFDAEVEKYQSQGYEVAFTDRSPRGVRIAYVDFRGELPGMLEIIELTDALDAVYAGMYDIARDWDGSAPIRPAQSVKPR